MHRFYVSPDESQGELLCLAGSEAHHASHVLRIGRGDKVTILDGAGQQLLGEVTETRRDCVAVKVIAKTVHPRPTCDITLLQGLPKGKLIEAIIQKATELGAARIVPLLAERTVMHLNSEEKLLKQKKWQSVAIESLKQCGSPWLPRVEEPISPQEFVARGGKFDLGLLGALQTNAQHPRTHFAAFERANGHKPRSISVWIGPEGDFSAGELDTIQAAGVLPITLGALVLRTDTAASYCLSIVSYELQSPVCSA